MSRPDIRLEIDGPDVVYIGPGRFSVNGAFVQLWVFAGCRVDCIDVYDGHLFVEYFGTRFDKFASFSIQAGTLQKETYQSNKNFC